MTATPIEELLNLTPMSDLKETEASIVEVKPQLPETPKTDSVLSNPVDDGTIDHSTEMNEVYVQALRAHKDIVDTAMQVEARHMGSILEQSAKFLEIALNASASKQKAKESSIKTRLAREKLRAELNNFDQMEADGTLTSDGKGGFIADRNTLIRSIRDNKELD